MPCSSGSGPAELLPLSSAPSPWAGMLSGGTPFNNHRCQRAGSWQLFGSPVLTVDNRAPPSATGYPRAAVCRATVQLLCTIWLRPAPVASSLREGTTPACWMASWAACRFMQVTSGISAAAVGSGDAAGTVGAGAAGVVGTAATDVGSTALLAVTVAVATSGTVTGSDRDRALHRHGLSRNRRHFPAERPS
jgi:hypothetical protein